jgi:winged helix DNA-binding protein
VARRDVGRMLTKIRFWDYTRRGGQMSDARVAAERLVRHRLTKPGSPDAADAVAWFGAVQAQDYGAAKWALAQRMRGAVTGADVDRAFDEGRILRTHLLRPTWHFVAAADIGWLLEFTAPRVHQALAFGRRYYGLTDAVHRRAARTIERALERDECLTRKELAVHLERAGIPAAGVPLAFVTIYAELEGVICSGPRLGKQFTYMLLARRAPRARRYLRDEALAELTKRYFRSHGPATVRDFVWWSGLTAADAKRGLAIVRARSAAIDGLTYWTVGPRRAVTNHRDVVHLLPVYDEYLVAYRDLEAVPRGKASWGVLPQAVVCDGQVIGTWKATRRSATPEVAVTLGRPLTRAEQRRLDEAIERYTRFARVE